MNNYRKGEIIHIGWVATVVVSVLCAFAFAYAQEATVTTQLSPNDSGSQVSALQTFLAADAAVYPEGLVTGFYGDLTTAAVQRYQCKNGIVCSGSVSSTGYGRVGPATLAKIQEQEGVSAGGGVNLPPVGYPTTGADVNAPVISTPTVAVTRTSAAVHWGTNEFAHSRVLYATYWPFVYSGSLSVADTTFDAVSDVTLTGLVPNTTYYYVLESVDASGNLQWSINHSFTTNP